MNNKLQVAIMFTGGLDSTIAACLLLKQNHKVHLLTFDNGICIRLNKSIDRVKELINKYGKDSIEHSIIDSQNTINFLKKQSNSMIKKLKSPLTFDLICRFSMEINTVIYCKKNNIHIVADGNNIAQEQIFLQQKKYLTTVDRFYKLYGINSIHPVYKSQNRNINYNYLEENKLDTGNKLFEKLNVSSQLLNQPFCLWAFVSFLFTSPLRKLGFEYFFGLPTNKAIKFRQYLHTIVQDYIDIKVSGK